MAKLRVQTSAGDNSREALLKAAKEIFARDGLDGATVRDLAQTAGVNLCLISYHFGGKEGLYRACLEEFGKARIRVVEEILSSSKEGASKFAPLTREEFRLRIQLLVRTLMQAQLREPELYRILNREAESGLPIARDVFESTFLVLMQKLVDFFKRAQKEGILRRDIDPLCLMNIVHGSFTHILRNRAVCAQYFGRSLEDERQQEKIIHTVLTVLLDGSLSHAN